MADDAITVRMRLDVANVAIEKLAATCSRMIARHFQATDRFTQFVIRFFEERKQLEARLLKRQAYGGKKGRRAAQRLRAIFSKD